MRYVAPRQQTQTQQTAPHSRTNLLGLPAELVVLIAEYLTDEDGLSKIRFNRREKTLCALRLTCRLLNAWTLDVFARQFFQKMAVRVTIQDLNRLLAISQHAYFKTQVRALRVCNTVPQIVDPRIYAEIQYLNRGAGAVLLSKSLDGFSLCQVEVEGVTPVSQAKVASMRDINSLQGRPSHFYLTTSHNVGTTTSGCKFFIYTLLFRPNARRLKHQNKW